MAPSAPTRRLTRRAAWRCASYQPGPRSWYRMPGLDSSAWKTRIWVLPAATQALALPRLRARRRCRAPSRVPVRPTATAVSPVTAPVYLLPRLWRRWPLRAPDCLSSGVRPAQEVRWSGAGKRVMSTPVSAISSWAARRPRPGTGLGLGQLLLMRGQQLAGHGGQLAGLGGDRVDPAQDGRQQPGRDGR